MYVRWYIRYRIVIIIESGLALMSHMTRTLLTQFPTTAWDTTFCGRTE